MVFIDMQQSMDYYEHWTVKQHWTHIASVIRSWEFIIGEMRRWEQNKKMWKFNLHQFNIIRVAIFFFVLVFSRVHRCNRRYCVLWYAIRMETVFEWLSAMSQRSKKKHNIILCTLHQHSSIYSFHAMQNLFHE